MSVRRLEGLWLEERRIGGQRAGALSGERGGRGGPVGQWGELAMKAFGFENESHLIFPWKVRAHHPRKCRVCPSILRLIWREEKKVVEKESVGKLLTLLNVPFPTQDMYGVGLNYTQRCCTDTPVREEARLF